jgi:uncharacterized protein YggE
MKSNSSLILVVLVCLALFFGFQNRPAMPTASAQTPTSPEADCDKSRSLQVNGTAVVYVTPDRATVQLGVQSNGLTPDAVHEENLRAIQRVITAVKSLGVELKYITTDHYIINPVYSDYSSLVIQGYRIDNTVSITLNNVALTDDVILNALKSGANEVRDVQFYTSELRKYRDQARDLAMQAAGEKAIALASAANAKTGCILSASENIISQYYGFWRGGRDLGNWAQNVIQNASPASGAVQSLGDGSPVSLGQIAVQAQITASYSLK